MRPLRIKTHAHLELFHSDSAMATANTPDETTLRILRVVNQMNRQYNFGLDPKFVLKEASNRLQEQRILAQEPVQLYHVMLPCKFCGSALHPMHTVKGESLCPKLRSLICHLCGASGDSAHVWEMCPR